MKLMKDFEELEGLGDQALDDITVDDNDDDDANFRPVNAQSLSAPDVFHEMEKRGIKSSGFQDTDREELQKHFDDEFKRDLEEARARRKEQKKRAAQQAGLQRRRLLMERTLQEEQDELSKSHQVGLMIDLIKENMIDPSVRIDVNSISARSLAKAIWVNTTVTCLDLSSNALNDHAGSYLARILKKNKTIKKIELDNNNLGPLSCKAFGESLRVNNTLVTLSLDSNNLTGSTGTDQSGILVLFDSLRTNKSLVTLNLWRTGIGAQAGHMLASCLLENNQILFLDFSHNLIDLHDQTAIAEKLDSNLAVYEMQERTRRSDSEKDAKRKSERRAVQEQEEKQVELASWLERQRLDRAEVRALNYNAV